MNKKERKTIKTDDIRTFLKEKLNTLAMIRKRHERKGKIAVRECRPDQVRYHHEMKLRAEAKYFNTEQILIDLMKMAQ